MKLKAHARKAGLCYARTDEGLELPVIDVTHPAFHIALDEGEQAALIERFLQDVGGPERLPAFLRGVLFRVMRRRSVIMRGLMGASGTFMSGMNTYLMKLGPDNLDQPFFGAVDRRLAGSPAGLSMRLRLQDTAELLADALLAPLAARPDAALHLLNIGGGPAIDSLNALILVQTKHPALLAGRPLYIHSLDVNTAGPHFGARALAAILAEGPLRGLDVSFEHTDYDWSRPEELRLRIHTLVAGPQIVAMSSEGALFEYGSDQDILGNLQALQEATPPDTVVAGSVTRADDLGRRLNGAGVGSRAAIHFREWEAFAALAFRTGWAVAKRLDRPLSYDIRLRKA